VLSELGLNRAELDALVQAGTVIDGRSDDLAIR